jgi:beta-glucosidase
METFKGNKNFHWGVASSAVQIEGAFNIDGKGFNIWDKFVQKKRKKFNNETHYVANDFYHRFREDLILVKLLKLTSFRFSISWSRILPKLDSAPNKAGLQFYNEMIDECLKLGIEPFATLYHWDLPQYLEDLGGWTNREVIHHFNKFVKICIEEFGDRVKYWTPLNEPLVFTSAGYLLGLHAPGRKGFNNFLPAAYHAMLANAEAGRLIKTLNPDLQVGSTFSFTPTIAASQNKKDQMASNKVNTVLNHLFLDPYLGKQIPTGNIKVLQKIFKYAKPEDNLQFDADFIGVQNYTQEVIEHKWFKPYIKADVIPAKKRQVETSQMGWEIIPESVQQVFKQLKEYKNLPEVFITECGLALPNNNRINNKVDDNKRVEYYESYLKYVSQAIEDGLSINGIFFWTLHDNFEWAEGYNPKFGFIEIDRKTQKRTLKSSALWLRDFLEELDYSKEETTEKSA